MCLSMHLLMTWVQLTPQSGTKVRFGDVIHITSFIFWVPCQTSSSPQTFLMFPGHMTIPCLHTCPSLLLINYSLYIHTVQQLSLFAKSSYVSSSLWSACLLIISACFYCFSGGDFFAVASCNWNWIIVFFFFYLKSDWSAFEFIC